MKILVTGAHGFCGWSVSKRLLAEQWQVFGAHRPDAPLPLGVTGKQIGVINAHTVWADALSDIEAVVHLAAHAPGHDETSPEAMAEHRELNTHSTLHLAREAQKAGVHNFIYLSALSVHGRPPGDHKVTEESPADPRTAFAFSKWEAERGLHEIAESGAGHMKVTILRPPGIYGPRVRGRFLALLKAIESGAEVPLLEETQPRSLIFVNNLADLIATVLKTPMGLAETYLASDDDDLSLLDMAKKIAHLFGRELHARSAEPPLIDRFLALFGHDAMQDRVPAPIRADIGAAGQRFGWKPPFTVNQGLEATVDWYKAAKGHG